MESQVFALVGMGTVATVALVMNVGNLALHRELETTTSVALTLGDWLVTRTSSLRQQQRF